ncbi:MAG: TraB/GumN family protein [Candidatus Woesearchaeota archaeon]
MITQRYTIVGTSHVSHESKELIKKTFSEFKPDIIAVELDRHRYKAMLSKEKPSLNPSSIFKIGFLGYLFAIIGRFVQKRVGKITGMNPGEEMLLGTQLAKNNKLLLCLIDQDIQKTLKTMSKKVRFKERMRLLKDLIFPNKKKIKIDINKIPKDQLIINLLTEMKTRYPGLYSALVDDRNKFMARQVFGILNKFPEKKLMVIVGAGHKEGMQKYIDELISNNLTRN